MTPAEFKIEQERLAKQTETYMQTAVVALPTLAEAAAIGAVVIAAANTSAALLADLFIGRLLKTFPLGIGRPEGDLVRIESNLLQIAYESPLDPLPRMTRLARSEPVDAGRLAVVQSARERKLDKYRWLSDADPCDLCKFNAAHVWPIAKLPVSHPSCTCLVVPVLKEDTNV